MDGSDDLGQYSRIPTIDDLIAEAFDVTYFSAEGYVQLDEIGGVQIPYLMPELLIKTKMGVRPKDIQDRNFLQGLLEKN